jgi:2'-hydroxyisoflavone reductase
MRSEKAPPLRVSAGRSGDRMASARDDSIAGRDDGRCRRASSPASFKPRPLHAIRLDRTRSIVMDRRQFIAASAAAAASTALAGPAHAARAATSAAPAPRKAGSTAPGHATAPLRILLLGGTGFIGPHMVRYARERGHTVTTFTRGRRQPWLFDDAFEGIEELHGDRSQPDGLDALRGRRWDVVIDNSGSRVEWTRDSAQLLKDSAERYIYVSSTGVFLPYLRPDIDESVEPVLADTPPQEQPSFGVMKALSEREAERAFTGRAAIVRPHFIVGPGDTTYRFPYWPARFERGGTTMVPGRRTDRVQFVDVRDLTEWMIRDVAERALTGRFNVAGPRHDYTMEQFVYGLDAMFSREAEYVWVDDYDFLQSYPLNRLPDGRTSGVSGVVPWILPRGANEYMTSVSSRHAVANGLTWRPPAETFAAAIRWWNVEAPTAWTGAARWPFTPEQEAAIIAAWRRR